MATATYTKINKTSALIEVTYSNGSFGMERITVRPGHSLYEAAYSAASVKATIQGETLGRFSRA
jgi:hypothetical protein